MFVEFILIPEKLVYYFIQDHKILSTSQTKPRKFGSQFAKLKPKPKVETLNSCCCCRLESITVLCSFVYTFYSLWGPFLAFIHSSHLLTVRQSLTELVRKITPNKGGLLGNNLIDDVVAIRNNATVSQPYIYLYRLYEYLFFTLASQFLLRWTERIEFSSKTAITHCLPVDSRSWFILILTSKCKFISNSI